MQQTVIGVFDELSDAQTAVSVLVREGIDRNRIGLIANKSSQSETSPDARGDQDAGVMDSNAGTGAVVGGLAGLLVGIGALAIPGVGPVLAAGPLATALAGAGVGAATGGIIGALTDLGVPEEDAQAYAEGVRRGGTLVTVEADGSSEKIELVMRDNNAVDIDVRRKDWQQQGWQGFREEQQPYDRNALERERELRRQRSTQSSAQVERSTSAQERTIPVVEEQARIGKEQVKTGGVRVYSRVTERPIEREITLNEERAEVRRQPANRPASEADLSAGERSFEIEESIERPVVEKQARVVEEVSVGKTSRQRKEKVRDTVRRKDVEMQRGAEKEDSAKRPEDRPSVPPHH